MSDYWLSTNSPAGMWKKSYQTPELDAYIIETQFIDAAMIAKDIKMHTAQVKAYRRRLGIKRDEF